MTTTATPLPYSRNEQRGWYFYDWANSAFTTSVLTVLLGPYLTTVATQSAGADGLLRFLGIPIAPGAYFAYLVSLSVFGQVFVLPLLGALADYSDQKKRLMLVFAFIGSTACTLFYFVGAGGQWLGGALFLIANICYGASVVFYNSFLPEIAPPDERDSVSSKGWALGYLGSGLMLGLHLWFLSQVEAWGLKLDLAVRISLASVGIWWAGFTLIPAARLRRRPATQRLPEGATMASIGFRELAHTLREAGTYRRTFLYLLAYLFYNDGIQTVIAMASVFGQGELNMPVQRLALVILMVQFVAFGGALLFNLLAKWLGAKMAIQISLAVWTAALLYIYFLLKTEAQFFVLGSVIALVLGGSQALSRSLYSQLIPAGRETKYFSLYEISERGSSWLGPLLFGLALQWTGSYRVAIVSLIVFFVVGLAILIPIDLRRGIIEAGNTPPAKV